MIRCQYQAQCEKRETQRLSKEKAKTALEMGMKSMVFAFKKRSRRYLE